MPTRRSLSPIHILDLSWYTYTNLRRFVAISENLPEWCPPLRIAECLYLCTFFVARDLSLSGVWPVLRSVVAVSNLCPCRKVPVVFKRETPVVDCFARRMSCVCSPTRFTWKPKCRTSLPAPSAWRRCLWKRRTSSRVRRRTFSDAHDRRRVLVSLVTLCSDGPQRHGRRRVRFREGERAAAADESPVPVLSGAAGVGPGPALGGHQHRQAGHRVAVQPGRARASADQPAAAHGPRLRRHPPVGAGAAQRGPPRGGLPRRLQDRQHLVSLRGGGEGRGAADESATCECFSDKSMDLVLGLEAPSQTPGLVWSEVSGRHLGKLYPGASLRLVLGLVPLAAGLQVSAHQTHAQTQSSSHCSVRCLLSDHLRDPADGRRPQANLRLRRTGAGLRRPQLTDSYRPSNKIVFIYLFPQTFGVSL